MRALRILLSLAGLAVAVGCASSRTILSQSELDSLPSSKGAYGGSYLIRTWSYLGSDSRYDHFRYSYTRGNVAHHLHVKAPSGLFVLNFARRPYRLPDDGVPLSAEYREGRPSG